MKAKLTTLAHVAALLVFFGWNAVFIALVYFGLLPFHFDELQDVLHLTQAPPLAIAALVAMAAVPPLASVLGALRLRRRPGALMALFYGLEVPVLVVGLYVIIALRDPDPGVVLLLAAYGVGAVGLVITLLAGAPTNLRPRVNLALTGLHATGSFFGLYLGGLLAFFVPPLTGWVLSTLARGEFWHDLLRALTRFDLLEALAVTLSFLTATLLVFLPAALVAQPILRWYHGVRALQRAGAGAAAVALTLLVLAGWGAGLAATARQPQAAAFAATEAPVPGAEEQAAWRQQAARTRAGLVNAYLQRFRYLDSTRHGGDVRSLYTHARYVDLGEAVAERAEAAFMAWARPFYFQDDDGRFTPVEAAARFRAYFDEDIQVGAAPEVRRATAMAFLGFRTGPAAPADAEARRVHLDRQQITVHPGRGYADVELHEVLRNTEPEDLEVVYAFELPPTAALTGLWLGASEDRSQAFPYVVAPRGAARVVYEQEVRRRVDPALLEQVGPRQFRLRVYPVPGQVDREVPAPALHVWLRYQTLPGPDGWPTPRRLSSRNVFWDGDTIFSPARDDEAWWPEVLPFDAPTPQVTLHVPVDDALALRFSPAGERPALPAGRRFLVVVDRSYSMSLVQDELHSSLDDLSAALEPHNQLDALLTSAPARAEPTRHLGLAEVRAADLAPFGGHGVRTLFRAARPHLGAYDAVIFITDGGSRAMDAAELRGEDGPYPAAVPLYLLALGHPEGLPDDLSTAVLGSAGDQVPDVAALLDRLAWAAQPQDEALVAVADGWRVTLEPAERGAEGPEALAAAWLIRAHGQARPHHALDTLDRLHALAVQRSVVTPYSSLLVLVNERQREALRAASADPSRFERPDGEVVEPLPGADGLGLSGAPEPGTWALLGLAAAGAWARRKRRGGAPAPN